MRKSLHTLAAASAPDLDSLHSGWLAWPLSLAASYVPPGLPPSLRPSLPLSSLLPSSPPFLSPSLAVFDIDGTFYLSLGW